MRDRNRGQRYIEKERQKDGERERQRDRQTDRQAERDREGERETRPAWAGFKTAEEGRTKIM